jgi:hypothetical protein
MSYDAANRVLEKTYRDGQPVELEPPQSAGGAGGSGSPQG